MCRLLMKQRKNLNFDVGDFLFCFFGFLICLFFQIANLWTFQSFIFLRLSVCVSSFGLQLYNSYFFFQWNPSFVLIHFNSSICRVLYASIIYTIQSKLTWNRVTFCTIFFVCLVTWPSSDETMILSFCQN